MSSIACSSSSTNSSVFMQNLYHSSPPSPIYENQNPSAEDEKKSQEQINHEIASRAFAYIKKVVFNERSKKHVSENGKLSLAIFYEYKGKHGESRCQDPDIDDNTIMLEPTKPLGEAFEVLKQTISREFIPYEEKILRSKKGSEGQFYQLINCQQQATLQANGSITFSNPIHTHNDTTENSMALKIMEDSYLKQSPHAVEQLFNKFLASWNSELKNEVVKRINNKCVVLHLAFNEPNIKRRINPTIHQIPIDFEDRNLNMCEIADMINRFIVFMNHEILPVCYHSKRSEGWDNLCDDFSSTIEDDKLACPPFVADFLLLPPGITRESINLYAGNKNASAYYYVKDEPAFFVTALI